MITSTTPDPNPPDDVSTVTTTVRAPLLVFNKVDRLESDQMPRISVDAIILPDGRSLPRVFISAADGQGVDALRQWMADASAAASCDSGFSTETSIRDQSSSCDDDLAETFTAFNGNHPLTA